jgi:hypothetical protein
MLRGRENQGNAASAGLLDDAPAAVEREFASIGLDAGPEWNAGLSPQAIELESSGTIEDLKKPVMPNSAARIAGHTFLGEVRRL